MKFPSKAEFLEWRKKHPKAGIRKDGEKCPIALFLKSLGVERAYVGYDGWSEHGIEADWAGKTKSLPEWARKWVDEYDRGKQ
jgi:hypothetical protein